MTVIPAFNWRSYMGDQWFAVQQRNEDTKVTIDGMALCFYCEKVTLTIPKVYPVCMDCFYGHKKSIRHSAILKAVGVEPDGVCSVCGDWCRITHVHNVVKLNVRACRRCRTKIKERRHNIGRKPQFKKLERIHGKNWREITGAGNTTYSNMRRRQGKTDGEFDI